MEFLLPKLQIGGFNNLENYYLGSTNELAQAFAKKEFIVESLQKKTLTTNSTIKPIIKKFDMTVRAKRAEPLPHHSSLSLKKISEVDETNEIQTNFFEAHNLAESRKLKNDLVDIPYKGMSNFGNKNKSPTNNNLEQKLKRTYNPKSTNRKEFIIRSPADTTGLSPLNKFVNGPLNSQLEKLNIIKSTFALGKKKESNFKKASKSPDMLQSNFSKSAISNQPKASNHKSLSVALSPRYLNLKKEANIQQDSTKTNELVDYKLEKKEINQKFIEAKDISMEKNINDILIDKMNIITDENILLQDLIKENIINDNLIFFKEKDISFSSKCSSEAINNDKKFIARVAFKR